MNDQLTPELEARVRDWLGTRAPAELPPAFAERIRAIPSASSPAGSQSVLRMIGDVRRTWPRYLAALVALLALALLAGGVILTAATRRDALPTVVVAPTVAPSAPIASASAPVSSAPVTSAPVTSPSVVAGDWPTDFRSGGLLPASAPAGSDHGTIETPLGRARWVHLQGDNVSLPDPFAPIVAPDGALVWFAGGGPGAACYNAPTSPECTDPAGPSLAVSSDLLAKRVPVPLPGDAPQGDLRLIDDTFWFVDTERGDVWRSQDLRSWVPTDVSGLRSPGPSSIEWIRSMAPVESIGGTTVAEVDYNAVDPGALLGYPGQPVNLGRDASGNYIAREFHLRRDGGDKDLGPIAVEQTSTGVRFLDGAGREVGHVDGVGPGFAEMWATRGLTYHQVAVEQGDRWTAADLGTTPLVDWPMLVRLGHSVSALVLEPDQRVRAWRTVDGRAWTGGTTLAAADGKPMRSSGVTTRDTADGSVAVVIGADGQGGWESSDGERWTAVDGNLDQVPVPPLRLTDGWVRTADQVEDGTWQVSHDGTTWEPVPALQSVITKTAPTGAGGSSESAIGDTMFFSVDEGDSPYRRDLWIVEFEEPTG